MRQKKVPLEQAQTLRGLPPEGSGLAMSSSSWERSQGASRFRDPGLQVMRPKKLAPGAHCVSFFTRHRDDSAASWHLEDVVAVMSHGHELGESWVPEDGIVWQENVSDVKVDEFGVVVVALAEGDGRQICPIGCVEPSVTPENGLVG